MNSPGDSPAPSGPVAVARASDLFEAKIIASYLESAGIPAFVPDEAMLGAMDGAAAIWANGVKVEVAAEHADEARRLLAEREERRRDVDETDDDDLQDEGR